MSALITTLAPIISELVKRIIPDADRSAEIDREVRLSLLEHADSIEAIRGQIILAEANSTSWLTSTWRPLLMMVVVAIIAMNYLVFPILGIVFGVELLLDLPEELWTLLTVGVGGYIVGRSGERMVEHYSQGGSNT
jgi:hypothetical protein